MRITQFIEEAHQASTIEELAGMMCDALEMLGYMHYCCYNIDGMLPDTDALVGKAQRMHYDPEFVNAYRDHRYAETDPLLKLLCRARGPFTWQQVLQLPLTAKQTSIMQLREQAGLLAGVGVPLQSADPVLIGINITATRADAPSDNITLSQIFALCNQFQLERARILDKVQEFVLPDIHLTPREREMLEWAAQGKSNGVIASITGISEKTVEFHFKSIFNKLDVSSRTTAVLKAAHFRLISMEALG